MFASTGGSDFHAPANHTVTNLSAPNPLRNFEKAKYAARSHGIITSYAANTHQGI